MLLMRQASYSGFIMLLSAFLVPIAVCPEQHAVSRPEAKELQQRSVEDTGHDAVVANHLQGTIMVASAATNRMAFLRLLLRMS